MLKSKPFLSLLLTRVQYNAIKLSGETAQKLEPSLSLSDALDVRTETTAKSVPSTNTGCNLRTAVSNTGKNCGADNKKSEKRVVSKCEKSNNHKASEPQNPGPPGGYSADKFDFFDIHKTNSKKWRTLSFIALSFVVVLSAFIFATKDEHPEPEFIPYEYMYRRTKRFPWRDGKTSLFHGPNNLIPEDEEERIDREMENEKQQTPRYKKHVNEEEQIRQRREQHAQEELERRKQRHEQEQQET